MSTAAQARARYAANPEKERARVRAYNAANPERRQRTVDEFFARHPGINVEYTKRWRSRHPLYRREFHMQSMYGISLDQYEEMLKAQGGVCAICKQPETRVVKGTLCALSVDHNHSCCPGVKSCGKCIRGLLCNRCNVLLSTVQENGDVLVAAMSYLMRTVAR